MSNYMIFGKDDCPHTQKARADFKRQCKPFIYINIDRDPKALERMLEYSNGKYMVPVIVDVDKDNVEIGYTGE
jgi:glutaredoxin